MADQTAVMNKTLCLLFTCCFYIPICFSQNIGIGTKMPLEKLHIAGNIKSDTVKADVLKLAPNAGEGKILTSDANGNASWKMGADMMSRVTDAPGNVGFGMWGDCATNGTISEYNPVSDSTLKGSASFGRSVAISGNFAVIGAPFNDLGIVANQGSAHVFQYTGNEWIQKQRLTDNPGHADDNFGESVAIAGSFIVVGQPYDDIGTNINQGSVCVFQYNGSSWVLTQKITDPSGAATDFFGCSVSITDKYLVVGARGGDVGANVDYGYANVYQYNGSSWVFMQKLSDNTGANNDAFGYSVSVSGADIVIGSQSDDVGSNMDQGAATFFRYNGTSWVNLQKVAATGGVPFDNFGASVSISGNYAVIGAPNDDSYGDQNRGSATAYHYNGFSWAVTQQIEGELGGPGDKFGNSVQISGSYMIIGGPGYHPTISSRGSAIIYTLLGGGWHKLQLVSDPNGESSPGIENFGTAAGIDGTNRRFLIGSTGYQMFNGKTVFGKVY
jgi:hypothetical protein